ncbi:hypothetical protein [Mucilaginibacter auburnensis]|uniref:hypothetical protein n=1 Tax=Mucilaginibacter auburnensis TaxID=1457233 RepID=UPI000C249DB0|nr:hypothetical protein [Mucilaginibacter auburnensis]
MHRLNNREQQAGKLSRALPPIEVITAAFIHPLQFSCDANFVMAMQWSIAMQREGNYMVRDNES